MPSKGRRNDHSLGMAFRRTDFAVPYIGLQDSEASAKLLRMLRVNPNRCHITESVRTGDWENLNQLLSKKSIEYCINNIRKYCLVHTAIRSQFDKCLSSLLKFLDKCGRQKLIVGRNDRGYTALHEAIKCKRVDYIQQLVELLNFNTSDILICDQYGNTPFHCVVFDKFEAGLRRLAETCEDSQINEFNEDGLSCVHISARERTPLLLKILLEHGGDVRKKCTTGIAYNGLHYASESGSEDCIRSILETIPEDSKTEYVKEKTLKGFNALSLAAMGGFRDCCSILIKYSDLDAADEDGFTALHHATYNGHLNIIKLLVMNGASTSQVTNCGSSVLSLASGSCDSSLEYLLDIVKLPENPQYLLKVSVENNQLECLKLLCGNKEILHHINYQFADDKNDTLLHISIREKCFMITEFLLEKNINKLVKNDNNEYPFHLAANQKSFQSAMEEQERLKMCQSLMKNTHKYVTESVSDTGYTALHLACTSGNMAMVVACLRKGARILDKENEDLTCIHLAAKHGNADILGYLLDHLDSVQAKELLKIRPHPLHLAAQSNHMDCCDALVKYLKNSDKENSNLMMLDYHKLCPVDYASREEDCEVFDFLLGQMKWHESRLARRLHKYFHDGLRNRNTNILESIISSDWCNTCFCNEYCVNITRQIPSPCTAFPEIIKNYPELACNVLDKHIVPEGHEQMYDFTPFEFIYYRKSENSSDSSVLPALNRSGLYRDTLEFEDSDWGQDHPLLKTTSSYHTEVLTHPLTRAWLDRKFRRYAGFVLYMFVLLDICMAVLTVLAFGCLWNDYHLSAAFAGVSRHGLELALESLQKEGSMYVKVLRIREEYTNYTHPGKCIFGSESSYPNSDSIQWQTSICALTTLEQKTTRNHALIIALSITTAANFLMELYFLFRVKSRKWELTRNTVRVTRFICISIFMFSFEYHVDMYYGLRPTYAWQCGVVAVMMTLLFLSSTLNSIPALTVFMPLSHEFIAGFFKLVVYIVLIILSFAISFHFLLDDQLAFRNLWYSLIKTLVWLLGDLGYDDTFLSKDNPVKYPILTNAIFVIFVTVIGWLIFNLVLANPSDYLEQARQKSSFYKAYASLKLHLMIDDCLPSLRRKHAVKCIYEKPFSMQDPKRKPSHNEYVNYSELVEQIKLLNKRLDDHLNVDVAKS